VNAATSGPVVIVSLGTQRLRLCQGDRILAAYPVSTARNGAGERSGSECTPRGWHVVRARIGADCPIGTVFVGRRPTGERYAPALAAREPERDWILTRILWLSGLEPRRNRFGDVDTLRRMIYIHGTPDTVPLGQVGSHGCIRMHSRDIVELFDRVPVKTRVRIDE